MFKARFFAHGDIWKAKVGSYPSFGWRSIWGSLKLVKCGVRWQVGNGKLIRVWGDAWLGGSRSGRVLSPRRDWPVETTVDWLIDPITKSWREDLVREVFLPFKANNILNIPISLSLSSDERCWALTSDGVFRVKDVYSFALANKDFASTSSGPDPLWAKLWKLKVPPKIREFSWRACWDIVPHGVNLF